MNQHIITEEQIRPLIVELFRRIGNGLELREEWIKLPNAERNVMAGDFYNIIMANSHPYNPQAERDKVLNSLEIDTNYSWDWCLGCPRNDLCMLNLTFEQCQEISQREKQAGRDTVLDVTLVKILEDFRMLSFNATSQHMEAISLYHAQEIVKQRLGEFVRGGQWG